MDESIYGGMIRPIEFNTLQIAKDIKSQGLESFIKMIQLLSKDACNYHLAMKIVYLPLGRKFSLLLDGTRKSCCIVLYIK